MDHTKKRQRQRAVIACMLLLTLMPFFLVKAFHVHGEHSCVSHNEQGHSRHDSPENCNHLSLYALPVCRGRDFYIRLYSDWQACKVSYLRGNRCHRHSFPAFPPCTPCVFVITPLRDSHAITVIACRGFSCPVLTDYNPFIFFQV